MFWNFCAVMAALRIRLMGKTLRVAVEGSQYWKLTGFRKYFNKELTTLLPDVAYGIVRSENACLIGAALEASAEPM